MVLTVTSVSSFTEYYNPEGYLKKNDQHDMGISLVTYNVIFFMINFFPNSDPMTLFYS